MCYEAKPHRPYKLPAALAVVIAIGVTGAALLTHIAARWAA